MSNMNVNAKATPYESLVNSKPAQFAKDNKGLTAAAGIASGVILKQAADHSQIAATAIKKGAVPLLSLGVAATGVALVHDAISGDADKSVSSRLVKGTAGTVLALGGVEAAGRAYGVSPLAAASNLVAKVVPQSVLVGAAASSPGLAAVAWGANDMQKNGVTLANAAAVGLGSTQASFYGTLIGLEKAPEMVQKIAEKGTGLVVGASLGLGAYALGKEAHSSIKDGKMTQAGLYGAGAAVLGVGGAHVLAKTVGLPGVEKVAQFAIKNPLLVGSVAVLGVTAGAYALYKKD